MSLFRKPKKSFQRRVFTDTTDETDDNTDHQAMPIAPPPPPIISHKFDKAPKPKSKPQPPPVLSFETEEEEGGEVFQIRKSSQSKKVARMRDKERQRRLKEAQKQQQTQAESIPPPPAQSPPPPPPPPLILSGRDALCAGKDDLTDEDSDSGGDEGSMPRFTRPQHRNVRQMLQSGTIPDAATIHAARKSRQRARELGDFIPLEEEGGQQGDNGADADDFTHDNNDGNDDDDDDGEEEEEERIDMDVNMVQRDQVRRREKFLAAQHDNDDDEADIDDDWEAQQIRKGVVTGAGLAPPPVIQLVEPIDDVTLPTNIQSEEPRTPHSIANKLREHLSNVTRSRDANLSKLESNQKLIQDVALDIEQLRQEAPKAADRFRFYQELRNYITDLVECLDEKVAVVNSLEQRASDYLAKKADYLIERRRQDVRDQTEEATTANMAQRVGAEYEEKQRRAAEREGRRTRRRRGREMTTSTNGTTAKHVEGMSSDDEINQQDTMRLDKERKQIEIEAVDVLEDVVGEYSSIASILIRFERWRDTDAHAYSEAYASLCLPKVVNPLIRLQMIFWDPLNDPDAGDLEKFNWYRTLALYGLHDNETESELSRDVDLNLLLPSIVEKLIVPKLTKLIDRCWDPMSTSQTLHLVGLIGRYVRKYPTLGPSSKHLINLFNAVFHRMKGALEHDVYIPITTKIIESRNQFFQRQFGNGLKLLKNMSCWLGILNDGSLRELAIVGLLNRYLLSAVKFCNVTDAASKLRQISLILPRYWLQSNVRELGQFSGALNTVLNQLNSENPLHLEAIDTIVNILRTLGN